MFWTRYVKGVPFISKCKKWGTFSVKKSWFKKGKKGCSAEQFDPNRLLKVSISSLYKTELSQRYRKTDPISARLKEKNEQPALKTRRIVKDLIPFIVSNDTLFKLK